MGRFRDVAGDRPGPRAHTQPSRTETAGDLELHTRRRRTRARPAAVAVRKPGGFANRWLRTQLRLEVAYWRNRRTQCPEPTRRAKPATRDGHHRPATRRLLQPHACVWFVLVCRRARVTTIKQLPELQTWHQGCVRPGLSLRSNR